VNIIAFVHSVFMIINLAWPRTPDAAWYDNYLVAFSAAVVLAAGIIVYLIQRARGVDLSVTIREIDLSAPEVEATEAMATGMSGKVMPGGVSRMTDERPDERGTHLG
jgi:hypothetical protein